MNIKKIYGLILLSIAKSFGRDAAKTFDCMLRFGRKLNLKNPSTLADKVVFIENHCQSPLAAQCTDKWDVREYVKEKGYEQLLVPVYGNVYSSFEEIPFEQFPEKFALKATHGCKMNYFCTNRKTFDKENCKNKVNEWLKTTYGAYSCEWHYMSIPHRIYCEEYLEDAGKMIDYKFHCLNGVPRFVLVCSNRKSHENRGMEVTLDLFDMEWKKIPEVVTKGLEVAGDGTVKKPETFAEMIDIARKLSKDFLFVRVDLYELNGKVYFGELTFTPANGVFPNYTDSFIREMGQYLAI